MRWGEYLCYGMPCKASAAADKEGDLERVTGRLEQALRHLGLSKFSSSVAVQFVTSRLQQPDGHARMARVVQFLLNLLNSRSVDSDDPERSNSKFKCPQVIPGLTGSPFWNTNELPWIQQLEASFADIRSEFLAMKEARTIQTQTQAGFQHYRSPKLDNTTASDAATDANLSATPGTAELNSSLGAAATARGQWNVCYFYLHGVDFSENLALCPHTQLAIDTVPRQYHHALFSALAPDTHVKPHCGPTNKKLRCHLPLYVPGAPLSTGTTTAAPLTLTPPTTPWLRVGPHYCALQEGKCILFDDSYEHEACNTSTDEPRVVLIVDIWHPDLSDEEVKFFEFINKAQIQAAKRISSAMHSETTSNARANDKDGGGGDKEDFFHVIQAAKQAGIREGDHANIWSEQQRA